MRLQIECCRCHMDEEADIEEGEVVSLDLFPTDGWRETEEPGEYLCAWCREEDEAEEEQQEALLDLAGHPDPARALGPASIRGLYWSPGGNPTAGVPAYSGEPCPACGYAHRGGA